MHPGSIAGRQEKALIFVNAFSVKTIRYLDDILRLTRLNVSGVSPI